MSKRYELTFEEIWCVTYQLEAKDRDDLQAMIDKGDIGEAVDQEWVETLPGKPDIQEI